MRKYFITFLTLLTILAVSCNKRPTQPGNFTVEEDTSTDKREEYKDESKNSVKTTIAGTDAVNPVIAVSGNNVILFYSKVANINTTTSKKSAKSIYHRGSANGGLNFSIEYKLASRIVKNGIETQDDDMVSPHVFFDGTSVKTVSTSGDKNKISRDGVQVAYAPLFYSEGSFSASGNVGRVNNATWKAIELSSKTTEWYSWVAGNSNPFDGQTTGYITLKAVAGVGRKSSGGQLVIPVSYSTASKSGVVYITQQSGSSWTKGSSLVSFDNGQREGKFYGQTATTTSGGSGVLSNPISETGSVNQGTTSGTISYQNTSDGFETYYDGTYTYLLSDNLLYRQSGNNVPSNSSDKMTITGAQGGSVAALSDGSIVTFTKEASGLVFRRIKTFTKDAVIE